MLLAFALLTATLLLAAPAPSSAQNYPSRGARIVVGFAAGGATDVTARLVELELTKLWSRKAEFTRWCKVIKDAGIKAE
jgi:tripartite-type tricarboxylate transporter receptor subunit TctC